MSWFDEESFDYYIEGS